MKKQYDEMFKKQCVELVVKEGRTISSIQREFDLGNGTLNAWIKKYSSPFLDNEKSDMEELRSLQREIQALKKENEFLKKAATFFASNNEKDAYTIALRMPSYIDRYARWNFEECVQWFQYNEAQNSNPAHFIKMFRQKSKQNWERRNQNTIKKKSLHGTNKKREFIFYNFLEKSN